MRHRRSIGWIAAIAVMAFLITAVPFFATQYFGRAGSPLQEAAPAPHEEHRLKTAALRQDMDATAALCYRECSAKFGKILSRTAPSAERKEHIQALLDEHHHMEFIRWIHQDGSNNRQDFGKLRDSTAVQRQLEQAESATAKGQIYHSGTLKDDQGYYMVLGIPGNKDNTAGESLIGVVRQHIVNEVERHQRRNLRLVPYPSEGRYRTKSVAPGTTEENPVNSGEENGDASHYYEKEAVVKFAVNPDEMQLARIRQEIDAKEVRRLGYTFVFRSHSLSTEQLIHYFNEKWQPEYVEPHYLYVTNNKMFSLNKMKQKSWFGEWTSNNTSSNEQTSDLKPIIPNDALYSDYQWNLSSIETERGWNVSKGSGDVIVAVLDTGVQLDHPDLQGKTVEGINIVNKTAPPDDDVGHGTHVAGIISATVNNGEGVAGLSWFNNIMPVKVLDDSGAGTTYSVAEGIIWATDNGAKVINLSLGNYASAQFLHDAIRYAYDNDVVIVAASGNDNTERPGYPAAYPEVFAVAATDANGRRASFSNYGDYIDVAAPGASIASTYPGGQYAALSGTSMASPHVSALAALLRSANPALTNTEVMDIMRSTAMDLGTRGKDIYYGYGQIDVVRALEAAAEPSAPLHQTQASWQPLAWLKRLFR
ncbi:peptidase S8 [Paenibacillaceae bacterium]|nr:peptidase S8 [Paenibacillaceae bacterium]